MGISLPFFLSFWQVLFCFSLYFSAAEILFSKCLLSFRCHFGWYESFPDTPRFSYTGGAWEIAPELQFWGWWNTTKGILLTSWSDKLWHNQHLLDLRWKVYFSTYYTGLFLLFWKKNWEGMAPPVPPLATALQRAIQKKKTLKKCALTDFIPWPGLY